MKIRSLWLLAVLCLPVLHAENLILNGDMKQNSGWKIWGSAPPQKEIRAKILSYPNAGANGERGLQIHDICNDHNPYLINFVRMAPVQKGQKYILKFQALADAGQVFQVVLQGEIAKTADRPGKYLGGPAKTFTGSGKWQEYSAVFNNIPAKVDKLGVCFSPFVMTSDTTRTGKLLLANVSLELDTTPPPVDPRTLFGKLQITPRELYIDTDLVKNGTAAVIIVGNKDLAKILVNAIKTKTGVTIPVAEKDPGKGNVITIGNRDRNDFVCSLYNWHYTLLDAKYPGKGGYEVRSLHNPFGNKRNFILCGGSDAAGDKMAVERLAAKIKALPAGKNLKLGYLADVKLDPAYVVPEDAKDVKLWEQSIGYGNQGYFGWNSLSKNLALFYVTGKKHYADEFLRLAFPKDKATEQELFKRDGEAYKDDFSDPIKSVYHYCGIMMILYWDLVEESPVWTDADRKKVNEAFYRQLHYTLTKKDYTNPYRFADTKVKRGIDRHLDWEGVGLYAVARYFDNHFPCPEAKEAFRLVRNFMDPRFEDLCYGTTSRFWAHSNMEPDFFYAVLAGDRKYINNFAVKEYARNLLITTNWENRPDKSSRDGNWSSSPLCGILQLAYLTQDDAFVKIMENLPLDKNCFRLGQSFYPAKPYGRNSADEANGRWEAYRGAPWKLTPAPTFPVEYAKNVMSYHDTTDDTGDFWFYDTSYALGLREIARTLAIYRLRIDGIPVLNGHGNTMRLYADGTSVAPQPYYAKILNYGVSGPFVYAEALVPKCDDFDWKRTAILRKRQYMILIDELTPLRDLKTGEFYNDFIRPFGQGHFWKALPETNEHQLSLSHDGRSRKYIFSTTAETRQITVPLPWTTSPMTLRMCGHKADWPKGQTMKFVTIIRPGDALAVPSTALEGNAAALALPEPALFRWTADGMELVTKDGKLVSAPGNWIYSAGAQVPVETIQNMLKNRNVTIPAKEAVTAPAPAKMVKAAPTIWRSKAITVNGKPWTILSGKNQLTVLDENLRTVLQKTLAADIGDTAYQASKNRIIVGCKDEKVIAFDMTGKVLWDFTSEMHPQLLKFGPYWHKSAIPGIRSLLVASWPDGKEEVFIGSEGTLEILDADGRFLDRKYLQYGPVSSLIMQKSPARLWCLRRTGGGPDGFILTPDKTIKNVQMTQDARKIYMGSFGFSGVGKRYLIPVGDKLYGDFSGTQNRVMLWDNSGKVLAHVNLGTDSGANSEPFGKDLKSADHIRLLAVLDDGTVTALTRRERAYFWTPDLKLKNMVILPGIPECGATDGKNVFAGFADGVILKIEENGTISTVGKLPGAIRILHWRNGRILAGDAAGNVAIW